ncbi:hypothetical protein QJ48_24710 [Paenibacillus sp. A3]|nr:hypothetical protein QJ48_24710 [Paenibacillus sp. A3]
MRKICYSALSLLIALSAVWIYLIKDMDSKSVIPVINGFYGIFIEKDYCNMYKYTDFSKYSQNPDLTNEDKAILAHGLLNNDRHWYGEIKRYDIKSVKWSGIDKRSAKIAVIALDGYGNEKTYYDKVIIEKNEIGWFITEYNSGSPWRTMKMP